MNQKNIITLLEEIGDGDVEIILANITFSNSWKESAYEMGR